ncbi:MAG: biotin/lipoyl-binding protein, partial [Chloroflexi bacterium]|nr:biotin/lipoyl-binding protein [Chloroflexota bacterium]
MLKLWQVGMLAAVLVGAVGATYGVYALASSSGQQKLGQDQQVIPVQYGNVVNQVSTSGSLVFPDRQALTFGTQGTVEEVLVKEGQEVTEGQPLAKLDAATVSSLEKAVAQARASLRSAEAALAKANDPYTALDLVQAEAKVADARLSLQSAQDALDKVLQPTPEDVAKARAAVSSAKQSAKNAAEVLDSLKAGPSEADIAKAQSQVDAAKVSLANAESEFKLTDKDWAAKLKTAQGALNTTMDSYSGVFRKWLGIELAESERGLGPDTLLASWGADLTALFDPGLRFQDIEQSFIAQGPAPDDPATPWNEVTVYTWMNIYPGPLVPTCKDGTLPTRGLCIKEEMDKAWDAYEKAVEGLEVAQIQAAKAIASAETVLTKAKDSLAAAQEALANLKAGP